MPKASLVGGALSVALLGAATPASAFCRLTTCQPAESCKTDEGGCPAEGAPLRWTMAPIPYRLHSRGYSKIKTTVLREVIRNSFRRWTQVKCPTGGMTSLAFQEQTEAQPNETDATFAVTMVNAGWPFDESALAQTTHDFGDRSGPIKNAVIEVNTATHDFRVASDDSPTALTAETGADIESVLVHEVGHYIGLAHSNVPNSIMAPSYCQDEERCKSGDTSRELGEDDIQAVCAIYPPAGEGPIVETELPPAPSTSFGCTQASSSTSAPSPVAAFGALVVLALVSAIRRSSAPAARP